MFTCQNSTVAKSSVPVTLPVPVSASMPVPFVPALPAVIAVMCGVAVTIVANVGDAGDLNVEANSSGDADYVGGAPRGLRRRSLEHQAPH